MDNPTEKRGRGRPRKLKKPTPEQNETTIPPPRTRGRPRKKSVSANSTPPASENIAPREKRGRGRPPKKTKEAVKVAAPERKELIIIEDVDEQVLSQSCTPATSPSVDDTESEETTLSTQSATDCYVENNNDSNGSYGADNITYGNNVTKNNGPITGSHKDNDTDELPNTIRDQILETNDEIHLPTSHCPATQTQQQLPIRHSIKSDYLYLVSKYIIPCALIMFIFVHYIHLQATLRSIGYCDSMYGNEDGMTVIEIEGVERSCVPCPPNGICSGGELSCPPPYCPHRSISNRLRNIVWPTAQKCVKDPIIVKHVSKMERSILNYLAQRQGEQQCRDYMSAFELHNSQHSSTSFPRVKTKMASVMMDLQHTFTLPTTPDQDYNRMDYLTETALDHVLENKHVSNWFIDNELYLGTDLASYSLSCWCWISIFHVSRFFKKYLLVVVASLGFWIAYRQWKKRKYEVNIITEKTLAILYEQRQKHLQDPHLYETGCSSNYLYTQITSSTDGPSAGIWNSVMKRLEHHHSLNHGYIYKNNDISQYFEYSLC